MHTYPVNKCKLCNDLRSMQRNGMKPLPNKTYWYIDDLGFIRYKNELARYHSDIYAPIFSETIDAHNRKVRGY